MGLRFPVALNPFKTRTPTTRLGQFGKALNPLNPVNAATMLLEEAIGGIVGKTLGPEAQQRVGYFSFGLHPGIVLNVLDAGPVSANQDQLAKQAQAQYIEEQKRKRAEESRAVEIEAPQQARGAAPSPATQRPSQETRPPVTQPVPQSPVSDTRHTDELIRQMVGLGVTGGMTDSSMRTWVTNHENLAEQLIKNRMGREARLAKEFAGFAGYPQ